MKNNLKNFQCIICQAFVSVISVVRVPLGAQTKKYWNGSSRVIRKKRSVAYTLIKLVASVINRHCGVTIYFTLPARLASIKIKMSGGKFWNFGALQNSKIPKFQHPKIFKKSHRRELLGPPKIPKIPKSPNGGTGDESLSTRLQRGIPLDEIT